MNNNKILFVDDDRAGREVALFNLKEAGYEVEEAENGEQALSLFDVSKHSLVITDIRMPKMSGIDLLQGIKKITPNIPVLVITAYASIETAVDAMKLGAEDFIVKPFDKVQLLASVKKALQNQFLKNENRQLKIKLKGVERPIVYNSKAMKKVISMVDRVATSDASILITGESGTGKELLARRLHVKSDRADQPFITISCGAIPADLLESELFGHARGAFTGAIKERIGRFRQADQGTVFLDEVAEIPLHLQVKLLRVLQEQIVDVVGKDDSVKVNVRIISATNKSLEEMIREKDFRDDLFYRLNVVNIHVPPLRNRSSDIPCLVQHFVDLFSANRELAISDKINDLLINYDWPGNIRELENACKRLVLLAEDETLSLQDLPPNILKACGQLEGKNSKNQSSDTLELPKDGLSLIDAEKNIILKVLNLKNWNVSQAATYLKVPRHVLAYRLQKYGIKKND